MWITLRLRQFANSCICHKDAKTPVSVTPKSSGKSDKKAVPILYARSESSQAQALQDDFQMRPDTAANRATIAAVVSAWESSKFAHEEAKLQQEAKAPRHCPIQTGQLCLELSKDQGEEIGDREPRATVHRLHRPPFGEDPGSPSRRDLQQEEGCAVTAQLQSSLDQSGRVRMRQRQKQDASQHRRAQVKVSLVGNQCLAHGRIEDEEQSLSSRAGASLV